MTQFSFPWECAPIGDGGPNSYSVEVVEKTNRYFNNLYPASAGLIYWTVAPYDGLLSATNPSASIVRIASGVGLVEGWIFESDADEDFDVSGGNANATDLIVLRKSRSGATDQTVRLAHLTGPAGGVATVTQTATTWEVPLWQVALDGSGNFSSLTDVRKVIDKPSGTITKIDEVVSDGIITAVDFQNIPDVFRNLKLICDGRTEYGSSHVDVVDLTCNGVATASYDYQVDVFVNPASTYSATFTNNGNGIPISMVTAGSIFSITSPVEILIPGYKTTGWYKNAVINTAVHGSNASGAWYREVVVGHLKQTAAINQLTLTSKSGSAFTLGTSYTLYGIS